MGGSTPAVWGDHIFLTCQDGADVVLMCVGADGKEIWRQWVGLGAGKTGPGGDEGNGASASPSTDGKHVYAFTGTRRPGLFRHRRPRGLEVQRPGALRQIQDAMGLSLDAAA